MKEMRSGRALSVRRGAVFAVGPSTPQFAFAQLGRVNQRLRPYYITARFNENSLAFALPIFASPDELRWLHFYLGLSFPLHTAPLPAPHGESGDRVEHYSWTHRVTPFMRLSRRTACLNVIHVGQL